MLCILIGLMFALVSFLPKLKIKNFTNSEAISDSDNFLYFGDIRKYDLTEPSIFLQKFCESVGNTKTEYSKYEKDLTVQIIMNSQIAYFVTL